MGRVDYLAPSDMTPEQKRINDEIAGARGTETARGPFAIWLRQPALAAAADKLGNELRARGRLDRRLFELMVLVVARHWTAQYEWWVHAQHAAKEGLSQAVIEAIRTKRRPDFARADERLVYDTITELNESRGLSQASYDRALAALGLDLLIELIAAAGFYTMVAMTLDAFDAPVPGGQRPLA